MICVDNIFYVSKSAQIQAAYALRTLDQQLNHWRHSRVGW